MRDCSELDLNSSYAYLLLCDRFRDTCVVAPGAGQELAGAAMCFRVPRQPDTLFVWQIAVRPAWRGAGLAVALLRHVVSSEACRGVRFLEAHVAPENRASEALFRKLARSLEAPLVFRKGFAASDFPDPHAPERLVRIGPMGRVDPLGKAEME